MADEKPVVGIIMGSKSDMPAMEPCMQQLDEFGISYEVKVASAHRKPLEVHEWASTAHERGIKVIIANGNVPNILIDLKEHPMETLHTEFAPRPKEK